MISAEKIRIAMCLLLLATAPGCSSLGDGIRSAGGYLGEQVGIVPDRKSYSLKEQEKQATTLISPEQEYHIGRSVAARILERFGPVKDPELQQYLQLVGNSLVVGGTPSGTFGGYHFMVIESEQINALAAPGGYVFITTGFLRALESEGELASVLAHEVAHVSKHHGIRMLQYSGQFRELQDEGFQGGSLNCSEALIQATALFAALVDSLVDTLLESGYSQDLEFEADAHGLEILRKTGYPPQAASEALQVLKKSGSSHQGGWFSTHPSADERLQRIGTVNPVAAGAASAVRDVRFRKALGTLKR